MDNHSKTKQLVSVAFGALLAVALVVVLTIAGELMTSIKPWLKEVFTHHWIGKGMLAAGVFALGYFVRMAFPLKNESEAHRTMIALSWITIVGTLALVGFFLFEAFTH